MISYPLCILPFDHRSGFFKEILHEAYPTTSETEAMRARELKRMIYEAFLTIWEASGKNERLGILVDEEFGDAILKDAKARGITHFLTVEASGSPLNFVHGEKFAEVLAERQPTGAKILTRYKVGDEETNTRTRRLLGELSRACQNLKLPLMAEILVSGPHSPAENAKITLSECQEAGLKPDLWKLEGLDTAADWQLVRTVTSHTPIIVLGRNAPTEQVDAWLKVGKQSGLTQGFAVGRTIFEAPLIAYLGGKITRAEAVETIAHNYRHFITVWQTS